MFDPWEGLLAPKEKVLWQGAPKFKVRFEWNNLFEVLFFSSMFIFCAVALAMLDNLIERFVMAILLLFSFYQMIAVHFWRALVRARQRYLLTNQRAMISTRIWFKTIETYPITKTTKLTFKDRGTCGDIYFSKSSAPYNRTNRGIYFGFKQIEDPRYVFSLIHKAQEER